jgi:molybdate transport system substrate-binding protein
VYAAASLREAFEALGTTYSARPEGRSLALAFDSSSALRAQIEQGAPADVFASADERNPLALAEAGLTASPPVAFADNAVVIVVPVGSRVIDSPADLAAPGIRVVAAGDAVPISAYSRDLLAQLGATDGYPEGFTAAVERNVVSREDNVRAALAKIELGEGDAAIVYATDALASDRVRTLRLPGGVGVTARYAAVAIAGSRRPEAVAAFLDWLTDAEAQHVLARFGFEPPG